MRSRSDEIINRILDDDGEEDSATGRQLARQKAVETTAEALKDEFKRAGIPNQVLEELLGFGLLVNKNDLLRLSLTENVEQWPEPMGRPTEVHERLLLEMLGKKRLAPSPPPPANEDDADGEESKDG